MDSNRIWILIGKKMAGDATPEDITELNDLIDNRADDSYPLQELEEIWLIEENQIADKSPREIKEKWENFKSKIPSETPATSIKKTRRISPLIWLAACLAFAFFVVLIRLSINVYDSNANLLTTTVQAPSGSTSKIILPDGSKVWLNANSKLTYKKQFGERFREVSLTGEAYFDVVKDVNHPFIVHTASLRLKVLGTAFNVRSFETDKTSEAALVRGSIEVTLVKNPDKKLILKPSEKIIVRNADVIKTSLNEGVLKRPQMPLITLTNVHYNGSETLPQEAQWMDKKLVFTSESFDDIAGRMERYYNVVIEFQDEEVKSMMFSGSFKDESIAEAMKDLQATGNFHYKIINNKITIYK